MLTGTNCKKLWGIVPGTLSLVFGMVSACPAIGHFFPCFNNSVPWCVAYQYVLYCTVVFRILSLSTGVHLELGAALHACAYRTGSSLASNYYNSPRYGMA